MSAADGKAAMSAHAARIAAHYEHARAKHPHFADLMFLEEKEKIFLIDEAARINKWRSLLCRGKDVGKLDADSVAMCELAEARLAYAQGNKAAAVEELYDTVAVLLRMVDVLEGRQELGNPLEGVRL